MSTFGERLRELRTKKGCTQREIAGMMGVSQWTVCNWENDRLSPHKATLDDLAALFGVTNDYLLHGEVTKVFTAPKEAFPADTPQVTMFEPEMEAKAEKPLWVKASDIVPPKAGMEDPKPMPSPIYKYTNGTCTRKSDALIYRAEDGKKLDDINLLIRHLRDMHITDDEKKRLHNRLSQMRTEVESVVLFGE